MGDKDEKVLFLPDDPIEEEGLDEFGHKALVNALYDCVKEKEFKKINVGLFGRWGTGKSSIVKLLEKRIEEEKDIEYFWFDAWEYSCGTLPHEFVISLNSKFKAYGPEELHSKIHDVITEPHLIEDRGLWFHIKTVWSQYKWTIILVLAAYIALYFLNYVELIPNNWYYSINSWLLLLVFGKIIFDLATYKAPIGQVTIMPAKLNPSTIKDIFETIVKKVVGEKGDKKLIIVIDNIDRCSCEAALEMLSVIKNLIRHEQCLYIIPCDKTALVRHLEAKGYVAKEASEFLRKFFQTSFDIPPFLPQDLKKFVDKLITTLIVPYTNRVSQVLVSAFTENPRSIKQCLNNLTAQYLVAEKREADTKIDEGEVTGNDGFMVKLLILRQEYPHFYFELERKNNLLELIEGYFRNRQDASLEQKLHPILYDDNENEREFGLIQFLRRTRPITVKDISPFLRLNKETYPSTISDSEMFKRNVNNGSVQYIVSNYNEIEQEGDKKEYIERIIDVIEREQLDENWVWVFNGTNILVEIFGEIPKTMKTDVADVIGGFTTTSELKADINRFDYEKMFSIITHMDDTYSHEILKWYVESISPENIELKIVEQIKNSFDIMPDGIVNSFNNKLKDTYLGNREDGQKIIDKINESPVARDKLITDNFIAEVANKMDSSNSDENKREITLYLSIKNRASNKTKSKFINTILSIISANDNADFDDSKEFGVQTLLALEVDDVPDESAGRLYEVLNKYTGLMGSPENKLKFVKVFFKFSGIFQVPQSEEFLNTHLSPIIDSASKEILKNILEMASGAGVKILKYDFLLDKFLSRIQNNLPDFELVNYVTVNVTKGKKAKVKDTIIALINHSNAEFYNVGIMSVENINDKFNNSQVGEMCNACLERSKQVAMPEKQKFVEAILKAFDKCPVQIRHRFAELTAQFILEDEQQIRDMGIGCFHRIKNYIRDDQKAYLINQVIHGIEQKVSQNAINSNHEPALEIVMDGQSILDRNDAVRLIEMLLDMRSEGRPKESKLVGIKHISKLNRMFRRKSDVLSALQADATNEDEDIKRQAVIALDELGMSTKKMLESKKEEGPNNKE